MAAGTKWGATGAFAQAAAFGLVALLLFQGTQAGIEYNDRGEAVPAPKRGLGIVLLLDGLSVLASLVFFAALVDIRHRSAGAGADVAFSAGALGASLWALRGTLQVVGHGFVTAEKANVAQAAVAVDAVMQAVTALSLIALAFWLVLVCAPALSSAGLPRALAYPGFVLAAAFVAFFAVPGEWLVFLLAAATAWFVALGVMLGRPAPAGSPAPQRPEPVPPAPAAVSEPAPAAAPKPTTGRRKSKA